ncbi:MAG: cellulase family glycosylhydrolase [Phycisphaerae bacterium]|nr:cellulase family glycosylhydrolase [Phycisphaerae bacterium]
MITRSNRIRAAGLAISLMSLSLSPFCLTASAEGEKKSQAAKLSKAEIMVKRIGKGINVDVSQFEAGSPVKVMYDPAQYDAVKVAGFQSVRFFVVAGKDPAIYKTRITDALDRGLAVVICLWGNGQWASKPKEGKQKFVGVWDRIAKYYRDYPEALVFELWNEPAGLVVKPGAIQGLKDGKTVMKYLNAVVPIIRKTNPGRILAIGGPGFNGGRELKEFVTPKYLTYKLKDGTGFEDDTNIIGIFHTYQPHKFTHWTLGLDKVPGWKDEVRQQISHPAAWSKKWRKPALLSEWGAWAPPCHSVKDFKAYIGFVTDECKKHNIGWMYYCAGFNNQWAFNILHTEDGWNQDALDILTGVKAPRPAPMSPLINTEFGWSTANWISKGSAKISVARSAGLSGPTALKVEVTKSDRAEVYQETPKRKGSPPGRYLISVRKGRGYRISFLAKSVSGTGTVKVRLANVSSPGDGFWTSTPVVISNAKREYTVEYRHAGRDVNDVRVAFLFGDRDQIVLLDRIALRGYRK